MAAVTKANEYPPSLVPRAGVPSVGMHRTTDHRYYWQGEGPYPSVTTAMKMFDKSDVLTGWAKRETAAFAVRHLDILAAHREHAAADATCPACMKAGRPYDRDAAAQKWVSSIPDYQRDAAADLGTEVHRIAEQIGHGDCDYNTGPGSDQCPHGYFLYSDDRLLPYAEQYRSFLSTVRPTILAIEYMGLNRTHGYAGTGDLIAGIGGVVTAIDIKTHTKPTPVPNTYYAETSMQLAACSRFDFIGREGDPTEYPMPRVDAYGVLLIGADGWRLIRYWVTDETFGAFLSCLSLYRWKQGEARRVVGDPISVEAAA